ncbi:ComF family protein [Acetivibrio sp.]|uniref:ComF family protein n=1 Tax=Acetivibrio sp. TaxID=1872092 RepID=UPI002D1FBAC4|nr:ComF family protein [Acetivibrio sp.]
MINRIINLIFPPKCIFCGTILNTDTKIEICKECYEQISFKEEASINPQGKYNYYDSVICVCDYSGIVKEAIRRYKFYNKPSYYRTFARLLAQKIKELTQWQKFDMIVSVPLHPNRERNRGYNQSYLIARQLSRELGIKNESRLLVRVKNTNSQSLLKRDDRLINIKDAFKITNASKIEGKTMFLVDDILTTGSTLNECSRVLKEAGAKKIVAAVIASGRR